MDEPSRCHRWSDDGDGNEHGLLPADSVAQTATNHGTHKETQHQNGAQELHLFFFAMLQSYVNLLNCGANTLASSLQTKSSSVVRVASYVDFL